LNTIWKQNRPEYCVPIASRRLRAQSQTVAPEKGQSADRVTLSSAGEQRDLKKMALFAGMGAALGVAAAAILCPAAGLAGLALSGLFSGVAGAAIADGALKTAGTGKAREFDPYNPGHVLDPDNLYHPRNPYNPLNFER